MKKVAFFILLLSASSLFAQWAIEKNLSRQTKYVTIFRNGKNIWAAGQERWKLDSKIYISTDSGKNWAFQSKITYSRINDIFFKDYNNGWAVFGKYVYHTTNGGADWVKVEVDPQSSKLYQAIDFNNNGVGVIVGKGGIARTTDGVHWQINENWSDFTESLDVNFLNDSLVFVCGKNGLIARSADTAKTWEKINPGFTDELRKLFFVDSENGYILGVNSLFRTTDSGGSWQRVHDFAAEDTLNDLFFLTPEKGWVVGNKDLILKTTDGGSSWAKEDYLSQNQNLLSIEMLSDSSGFIGTDNFVLKRTPGKFLEILEPENATTFYCGDTIKISWDGYGVENVDILFSKDDGTTWETIKGNLPLNNLEYDFTPRKINSDFCKIKIQDSSDPSVSSESISLTIGMNPPTDFTSMNEIKMWFYNNGIGSFNPNMQGAGLYWPGGISATKTIVFMDGVVWGGKVNGKILANGNTYRTGLRPGKVLTNGLPDDPNDLKYGIWKIRNDWQSLPQGVLKERCEFDYQNWPGDLGAPYKDVNGDGIWTQGIDEPNFLGDETMWFVANDLDTATSKYAFGSPPIGLEIGVTVFSSKREDLKNTIFKKYKFINKSGNDIKDMYLGIWSDPDLGDANDDYMGCDTTLDLGYVYNGQNEDWVYGTPPAVGYVLLQGPKTKGSETDSAFFEGKWIKGFKNLGMTSFFGYLGGNHIYDLPPLGMYEGTIQIYNNFQGIGRDGSTIVDPNTGDTTQIMLAGDPVNKTGWYEGEGWPQGPKPGDRRFLMGSGPFEFKAGETQEFVFAIIVAQGNSALNSLEKLKNYAREIKDVYYSGKLLENKDRNVLPVGFELKQNYPNPFGAGSGTSAPVTTIKYSIPAVGTAHELSLQIRLTVYDVLGRKVVTLVNRKQKPGNYSVRFNASNLASGVYFYSLRAGNFVQTRKMILIK